MGVEQYIIYIWLAIFIVSIIVEICTFELISVWFSVGAIFALILSVIPNIPWFVELIVFFLVSIICLASLRTIANKALKRKLSNSNIDEIIGQKGVVIKKISSLEPGEIRIRDVIWTALPVDENDIIKTGSIVKVISLKGNKLFVKEIRKEN